MNPMMMKEVSEISKNNISESPLGKSVEGKDFDKPMTEYDKPFENKYSHNPIEGSSGHWEGERGESKFIPDSDAVPKIANSEGKTFGEILPKYGIDGINFSEGEPDFSPISKGDVKISEMSSSRPDNFAKADIAQARNTGYTPEEVSKWRKDNGYTWHECRDGQTMQKLPSEVHSNIRHSGGVSMMRALENSEGGK
ncbi:MAG: HNH endonuclease signature motif containing protein [Lactococcus lactis]|uniref:HNH endonuclease signature motif containing protein n=2 Tax=Streptococcaceae TaxID=1300 RepID=UPI000C7D59C5|nr:MULTISPECIES: HNH endonuclease [Lactococcus]MCT4430744.1 HNH endonuclease [Lactococcus cremoris]QEX49584.1 hypothetical protein FTN78_chr1916 [Lactococcus lactis subsp. lactis bv. diacetylactis]